MQCKERRRDNTHLNSCYLNASGIPSLSLPPFHTHRPETNETDSPITFAHFYTILHLSSGVSANRHCQNQITSVPWVCPRYWSIPSLSNSSSLAEDLKNHHRDLRTPRPLDRGILDSHYLKKCHRVRRRHEHTFNRG